MNIRQILYISLLISNITCANTTSTKLIEEFGMPTHRSFTVTQRKLIADTITSYEHCKLLVIGTGLDSGLWMEINKKGETYFLEYDQFWINLCKDLFRGIQIIEVAYDTILTEWESLLKLPDYSNRIPRAHPFHLVPFSCDVLILDGPESHQGMPSCIPPTGRMQAFFLAHTLFSNAQQPLHLFIHDTDREVEQLYANKLFTPDCLVVQEGNLSHYKNY